LRLRRLRGKDANQQIWKYDGGLVGKIAELLKQAAIEEGQWAEKRDHSGSVTLEVAKARLNHRSDRVAAAKAAALNGFSRAFAFVWQHCGQASVSDKTQRSLRATLIVRRVFRNDWRRFTRWSSHTRRCA
jgi:hypothetical protein